MKRRRRGEPARFEERLTRAQQLVARRDRAATPLDALVEVLHHQLRRAGTPEAMVAAGEIAAGATDRQAHGQFPLLEQARSVAALDTEVMAAAASLHGPWVPAVLDAARAELQSRPAAERIASLANWLDDPGAVEPSLRFWFQAAAGSSLELAAAALSAPSDDDWHRSSCPVCGGPAQVSVIAEESGEFLGGSPRSLVCARCATWWPYPRAICPSCGEDDPRRITPFVPADDRLVRIDGCQTCHCYMKTFDLRERGSDDVVPLVDDVATLALDLWARQAGFDRASLSFAGI